MFRFSVIITQSASLWNKIFGGGVVGLGVKVPEPVNEHSAAAAGKMWTEAMGQHLSHTQTGCRVETNYRGGTCFDERKTGK